MGDFLDRCRDGKDPICPVEVGHRSNSACILTHIAAKTGRTIRWDPVAQKILDDPGASALLDRVDKASQAGT